ncbi:MAG: hypothetical protein R3E96_06340 [Planctomycetota bacterium]
MLLLAVGFVWVLNRLQLSASRQGVGEVELGRYRLHSGPLYFSGAWRNRLERILRKADRLTLGDTEAIAALTRELAALSFVEEVGVPEPQWPDGLVIPLRLREPAACVRVGGDYLPVSDDGVVMAGYSYGPHEVYGAWLPILGPTDRLARLGPPTPGDRIDDPALLDALKVARSLQRYLTPAQQRLLGRIVIDASHETSIADNLPGGVFLDLEGKRRILFGRPPGSDQPGELPVDHKWRSILSVLEAGEAGPPWDLLDVRFDVPRLALRTEAGDGS